MPSTEPDVAWLPISGLLQKARDALPVGQLIKGEVFSLFEAMSAVEIGNPKMDAAATAAPKPMEEMIAEGKAPVDLTPQQLIAIMDKLLLLEAMWHMGSSLGQTVYTSLHMLRQDRYGMLGRCMHTTTHSSLTPCISTSTADSIFPCMHALTNQQHVQTNCLVFNVYPRMGYTPVAL